MLYFLLQDYNKTSLEVKWGHEELHISLECYLLLTTTCGQYALVDISEDVIIDGMLYK